jgi:hypothetical protein
MSSSLTPAAIANTLSAIGKEIDELTTALPDLDEDETLARLEWKRAYNKVFLTSEGSVDVRRAYAEEAASDLEREYALAGVALRAAKDELRALRDRLEIGRSLSALMRMEWGAN